MNEFEATDARSLAGALGCSVAVAQNLLDWQAEAKGWKTEALAARELLTNRGEPQQHLSASPKAKHARHAYAMARIVNRES